MTNQRTAVKGGTYHSQHKRHQIQLHETLIEKLHEMMCTCVCVHKAMTVERFSVHVCVFV